MWAWELLELTVTDRLFIAVRKRLTEIVLLLQCSLRAAELERQAAEEPLRSDIDIARLKAQILGASRYLRRGCERRKRCYLNSSPLWRSEGKTRWR